jgi:predicted site-specific integrase-resolvase
MSPNTTTPEGSEPWRSKAWIAEHYAISVRTVERWLHAGCPSVLLRGGVRRLRLSHVERFLTEEAS